MTRRHRYIRFFISSTFADMTRERNLLQEIFHDLNARYEPHHWQIEYVDLRWGITSEAGSDNRTMRICLEELERCRSLSPRPNFIILTGERYGWRPLPEVLSRQESECIRRGATAEELRLFERWYRFDTNQLPEPVLLLQPRTDEYLDDTNWDLKVYRPLRALFERLQGPLPSATELEIRHGALQVEDAREHVVAYFRHLHDIPAERLTTYEEPEATPVRRLETLLRSRLAAENILTEEIPFAEYETTEFGQRFRREMTARLTRIIDRVVAQTPEEPTEEEIHLDRIETDHPFLVGREEELSALERYLHDPQANHALWLRSCPGAGKTALLAALVRRCRDTHRVILRLCAETDRTRNGSRLLNSIWTRMSELFPPEQWVCRDLPGYGPAGTRSPLSASEMFRTRLRQIRSSSRPLLILVDGMEQLSDEGSDEFFSLAWADGELSPDVRIILTSSDDPRLNPEPRRIEIRTLETLPEADALGMVEECLRRSHRTLSDAQRRRMEQAVAASDRRPVYLSLLADLLQRLHSYEEPAVFPADFEALVRTALDQLVTTHDHDRELIRLAFSLFAADRRGLSQPELLRGLARDRDFTEHLQQTSHHAWIADPQAPSIPPILWTRLFGDVSFFFRMRHGPWGDLLSIRHGEFAAAIRHLYLEDPLQALHVYLLLAGLYEDQSTPHALSELFRCRYRAFRLLVDTLGEAHDFDDELIALLTDPRYLYRKQQLDREDLMRDFDRLAEAMRLTGKWPVERVLNLKNDLSAIRPGCNWEQFLLQGANLHPASQLRRLIEKATPPDPAVLHDALSATLPCDTVVHASTRPGSDPLLSNDGSRLLTLWKNRREVRIEDLREAGCSRRYALTIPIVALAASDDLRYQALLTGSGMFLQDSLEGKTLLRNTEIPDGTWVSLSSDGRHCACGGPRQLWSDTLGRQAIAALDGKLSPSGRNLWLALDAGLYRIDLSTGRQYATNFDGTYSAANAPHILASDEERCILQTADRLFYLRTYDDRNGQPACDFRRRELNGPQRFIGGIDPDRMLTIDDTGVCQILQPYGDDPLTETTTSLHDVTALSRNLLYAYSSTDRQVYDLQRLLKTFRVSSSWNRGINTLASDNAGACIAVSMGINALQEYAPELLLAEEGSTLRKLIPRRDTRFFSTCDVSPTGDRIWLSEAEASGSLLLLDRRDGLIAERPESGSRISIRHTDDGRFVAACVGDRISDPAPQIDLLTRDGDLLRRFTPKAPRSELLFKGPVTLSPDNRYLVSCDGDIVDLVDERLVYLNDRWDDLARCVDPSPLLPALRFAIHPFGHLLLGERRIVDLATGTVTETAFGGRAIGCTRSGRYLFLLDGERNLLVSGLYPGTAEPRILARAVNEVFPTDNERYLFARQLDGTLLFIDLRENRILQRAFLAEGRLFRTTRRGLAAVSGDGRLCLFEPAAEFGLQRESTVTIARRWDLATGRQSSTPEAVCPACGQVFTPPSQLLDRIRRHPASQAPDWEREELLTVCPTCHATLRCNPHIVE